MKDKGVPPEPKRPAHRPGNYVCCTACGRLLRIEWATRSIVCACGARVRQSPPSKK